MLAQEGANVVIVARRKEKLDEAIQYIKVPPFPFLTNPIIRKS